MRPFSMHAFVQTRISLELECSDGSLRRSTFESFRVQDGVENYWLRAKCEEHFSKYERGASR